MYPKRFGSEPGRYEPRKHVERRGQMTNTAPVGSDVSAGTYRCTNCGYELTVQSVESLPPCPKCAGPNEWQSVSGGDSSQDPYPDKN
jgi:Zn finger protein HypA/HybF involved in hydrogenase expression